MAEFQIITDSSCDVPRDLIKKNKIDVVPFYVSFDQQKYYKEVDEIAISDFYKKLESERVFPKTSLPSVQDYINKFTYYLDKGIDIICICLTDKFSGSYQAAVNAKNIMEEEYEDAKITIINSILATSAQGLLVLEGARMQQDGLEYKEVVNKIEKLKGTARIMFTVGTLEYLQKGGRIGKVSALAGSMLNLKPLIILRDGELFPHGTIRGRKKSLKKVIEITKDYFNKANDNYKDYNFCITTGTSFEEAEEEKKLLEKELDININYPIFTVGVTIGTNTGPDPVGVCFIKKYEKL